MSGFTEVFNSLVNAMNVLGGEKKRQQEVREAFSRQHRTLQQQFVKVVIVPVLQELAQAHKEGRFDGRNQYAAELATKLLAGVTEDDLYLPLI